MLFESKLFPLVRDHEIGVLSPGFYVNKTANSGTLVRQKRRVDGCRLLQVFVMQEVTSSALTGFSAIADFALLCFLVSNTPSFFFFSFSEPALLSFPLRQDALQYRPNSKQWGHTSSHWPTLRASLSKQMEKALLKNKLPGQLILPVSHPEQQCYRRTRILQTQMRGFCVFQKDTSSTFDTKCLEASPVGQVSVDCQLKEAGPGSEFCTRDSASCSEVPRASDNLTHTDEEGRATMVDVGGKPDSRRRAVAGAVVRLGEKAFGMVRQNQMKKGDVLAVAQIAGIQGAKLTSQLIPLCHNIPLSHVEVSLSLDEARCAVVIHCSCQTWGKTGVEMEALTAASLAALTVYDMCKAVTHDIVIEEVKLLSKTGGQRGDFSRA